MLTTITAIAASIVLAVSGTPSSDTSSGVANSVAKISNVWRALRPW